MGAPPAPEPARLVLTPLELVIYNRSLGWVTLAYSPGVDMTQPTALVLDDRRLGPPMIGWITPDDHAARRERSPLSNPTGVPALRGFDRVFRLSPGRRPRCHPDT